jgi:threonylcarbamoyladenosine tRNA methylthiotransferase CDKAL1
VIKHKVYVKTFGCSLNISDSEFIISEFLKKGFTISSFEEADFIVINTCGVKQPTENKILNYIKKLDSSNKKIIIAGCLPKINLERLRRTIPKFDAILTPDSYPALGVIIDRILQGESGIFILDDLKLTLNRDFRIKDKIGIVPIAYGCLGQCSYCCVRFARGILRSFSVDDIINYTRKLIKQNCVEIWYTAQDTAAYGNDINSNLALLLKEINKIPEKFNARVGMMNPQNVIPILADLIEAYKGDKIYKFLHLPIQSGDDLILQKMNRKYNIDEVKKIIKNFRSHFDRLTLSTDIIVGYPGETEEQFLNSISLIEYLKPSIVNISRYGDRPKTPSSNKKDKLRGSIIKNRSRLLTEKVKEISLENNSGWKNWKGPVTIVEKARKDGFIARNFAYKPILIKEKSVELGRTYFIEVFDFKPGYLIGKLINNKTNF